MHIIILIYTYVVLYQSYIEQIDFIEKNNVQTPVTFFDARNLHKALDTLNEAFHRDIYIYYALKSCYNKYLLSLLASNKVGVEVLSELEYDLAIEAGFKSIILNGMGRSYDLLARAINENNVVIVDSLNDLDNLRYIAENNDKSLRLGVRIRLDLQDVNPENSYSSDNHPLGNNLGSELFKQFIEFCNSQKNANWEMLHVHVTINETSSHIYKLAINKIANSLLEITKKFNIRPSVINLGGGFEVYNLERKKLFFNLFEEIEKEFNKHLTSYKLAIEPGRYLSGYAGYTIGKVLDIKIIGNKYWIITDIGTNTLIPIANARYKLAFPAINEAEGKYLVGLTDGITSPVNNIIFETRLDALPQIGSYLCIENTGSYTDVYSTFWAYPPHMVCWVDRDGKISISRTVQDILKLRKILLN